MRSKLIISNEVTSASVHDSQVFDVLLNEQTQVVFADSAYMWNEIPENIRSEVMTHAVRNHPLNEEQIKINHLRSSIRCRVEHVFGFIENSMHGSTFKGTTLIRAKLKGMPTSLTYNLFRVGQVKKAAQIQRRSVYNFNKMDLKSSKKLDLRLKVRGLLRVIMIKTDFSQILHGFYGVIRGALIHY